MTMINTYKEDQVLVCNSKAYKNKLLTTQPRGHLSSLLNLSLPLSCILPPADPSSVKEDNHNKKGFLLPTTRCWTGHLLVGMLPDIMDRPVMASLIYDEIAFLNRPLEELSRARDLSRDRTGLGPFPIQSNSVFHLENPLKLFLRISIRASFGILVLAPPI